MPSSSTPSTRLNHLADIGAAHPKRVGPIDFALLLATTVLLGWMLVQVLRERRQGGAVRSS